MSEQSQTTIRVGEIRNVFKESYEKNAETFSEVQFQEFLKFLEIDFYDWVRENIRQFNKQEQK